jgi:hypothetical protein
MDILFLKNHINTSYNYYEVIKAIIVLTELVESVAFDILIVGLIIINDKGIFLNLFWDHFKLTLMFCLLIWFVMVQL